jgi:hypothetical protein
MHRPQVALLFIVLIAFNGAHADSAVRIAESASRDTTNSTDITTAVPRTTAAARDNDNQATTVRGLCARGLPAQERGG